MYETGRFDRACVYYFLPKKGLTMTRYIPKNFRSIAKRLEPVSQNPEPFDARVIAKKMIAKYGEDCLKKTTRRKDELGFQLGRIIVKLHGGRGWTVGQLEAIAGLGPNQAVSGTAPWKALVKHLLVNGYICKASRGPQAETLDIDLDDEIPDVDVDLSLFGLDDNDDDL